MNEPGHGPANEPRTVIEEAADAAMEAASSGLLAAGLSTRYVFVALVAGGLPEDTTDSATSVAGDELPVDPDEQPAVLLGPLLSIASSIGKQIGLTIAIVPAGKVDEG